VSRIEPAKVALVTGAGRGIGKAIAEHMAGLGYSIAVHGRREDGPSEYGEGTTLTAVAEEIADQHGVDARSFRADLTYHRQSAALVTEVENSLGPIDVAVLNAGGDIGAEGGKPPQNDCILIAPRDVRTVSGLLSARRAGRHGNCGHT